MNPQAFQRALLAFLWKNDRERYFSFTGMSKGLAF